MKAVGCLALVALAAAVAGIYALAVLMSDDDSVGDTNYEPTELDLW